MDAKAGHNPISLLLTTNCESELLKVAKEMQVDKRCENNFSKMLDDEAKSRLESRFFAADNKTMSATQNEELKL